MSLAPRPRVRRFSRAVTLRALVCSFGRAGRRESRRGSAPATSVQLFKCQRSRGGRVRAQGRFWTRLSDLFWAGRPLVGGTPGWQREKAPAGGNRRSHSLLVRIQAAKKVRPRE